MNRNRQEWVRSQVRDAYARLAHEGGCCGAPSPASEIGIRHAPADEVPAGAELGLSCGNPVARVSIRPGDMVVDLGSGAGFDCFVAAECVGPTGRVIGIDMTPEMVHRARENAQKTGAHQVEFLLSEIENTPLADGEVDVVLSNCVISLTPDREAVFREAYRILKPGGSLAVSDVVATAPLPLTMRERIAAVHGCAPEASIEDLRASLLRAGFERITVSLAADSASTIGRCMPGSQAHFASVTVAAAKALGAAGGPPHSRGGE